MTDAFSPEDQLLTLDEVCKIVKLTKSRLYYLMNQNKFPRPINVSTRCVAWLESEVYGYIDQCIKRRNSKGSGHLRPRTQERFNKGVQD